MTNEKITHLDLFSGIGGFALAADRAFGDVEHIFCDNEPFAQEILKKHWPTAPILGDIRSFTNTRGEKSRGLSSSERKALASARQSGVFILTGGFPCQPFSQAGRRRGEEDDRFLWPEMLRVVREFSPLWVVAENVRGLLTQGGGVVFERVCTDLEAAGYEVQPIIIPAVAVGAPHRRDRVWFVAHKLGEGLEGGNEPEAARTQSGECSSSNSETLAHGAQDSEKRQYAQRGAGRYGEVIADTSSRGHRGRKSESSGGDTEQSLPATEEEQTRDDLRSETIGRSRGGGDGYDKGEGDWNTSWLEVATRLCRVDDGVRTWVDGRGKKRNSRNARLKALGNAIVPAVAEQIMLAIKL